MSTLSIIATDGVNSQDVACTVAPAAYLAHVRVLADSWRRYHPGIPFVWLVSDFRKVAHGDAAGTGILRLTLRDLEPDTFHRQAFLYSSFEFSTMLKPALVRMLMRKGAERVLYLDPDTCLQGPLDPVLEYMNRHAAVVTPHLVTPPSGPDRIRREANILLSGSCNAGLLGFRRTEESMAVLSWWLDRLRTFCGRAIEQGLFYDQKWVDFLPVWLPDCLVIRDKGINVGHWRLPEHKVTRSGDGWMIDNTPLRLMHFSGFDPDVPQRLTRYQIHQPQEDASLLALQAGYARDLAEAGYPAAWTRPYGHDAFDNGTIIPPLARDLYRDWVKDGKAEGNPFDTSDPDGIYQYLARSGPAGVPQFWEEVRKRRPDLLSAFPGQGPMNRMRWRRWIRTHGIRDVMHADGFMPGHRKPS